MAGTETGIKYIQRKLKSLDGPRSDEGIIDQAEAKQSEAAQARSRAGHVLFDDEKLRDAAWNQRMNAAAEYNNAVEADAKKAKGEGKKKGGVAKVKGWGIARGARKAKNY